MREITLPNNLFATGFASLPGGTGTVMKFVNVYHL